MPHSGSFRRIDFPDRNGVTFEFGNFQRETADLAIVLDETAHSFHRLDEFIYNLARSYYMFIGIHPFWDGNGRAGRCFLNFLFMKKGLPPVVLDDREEVLALPRYGGSMEDMHNYLKGRLQQATETYFYERWKLESFGFLRKRVYNTAFDSGFHFRQIEDSPPRIEVDFQAYVCGDRHLREVLADQCRVVFPEARLLDDMTVSLRFLQRSFHGVALFLQSQSSFTRKSSPRKSAASGPSMWTLSSTFRGWQKAATTSVAPSPAGRRVSSSITKG